MYRKSKPADTAGELFQQRLHQEVADELASGANPLQMYEEALRFGDKDRARILERVGPTWLGEKDKARFWKLVRENESESVKEARKKKAHLENIKRVIERGEAIRRLARRGRS